MKMYMYIYTYIYGHVYHLCLVIYDSLIPDRLCSMSILLSLGLSRQEYWSGYPFPSQGIFLTQGSNPHLLYLLHCRANSLTWDIREALFMCIHIYKIIYFFNFTISSGKFAPQFCNLWWDLIIHYWIPLL